MTEGPTTPPGEDPKREYADERDMDRFWAVARLEREPARQWWYIPFVLVLILVSIPWYAAPHFVELGEVQVGSFLASTRVDALSLDLDALFLGLPVWIWIPIVCTLGLSILTSVAVLRFWRDGDSDSD